MTDFLAIAGFEFITGSSTATARHHTMQDLQWLSVCWCHSGQTLWSSSETPPALADKAPAAALHHSRPRHAQALQVCTFKYGKMAIKKLLFNQHELCSKYNKAVVPIATRIKTVMWKNKFSLVKNFVSVSVQNILYGVYLGLCTLMFVFLLCRTCQISRRRKFGEEFTFVNLSVLQNPQN